MKNKREQSKNDSGSRQRVRYAVVGLGYISQSAVLPAFAHARTNSQLVGLVSDDPKKLAELGAKYEVLPENCCSYSEFDTFLKKGTVDAVYIALPNNMHCDFTIRAARQGVHVLCEKPMAITNDECARMIRTTDEERVKLMIAYRLHFNPANLIAVEVAQSGRLGALRHFESVFSMNVKAGDIRLQRALGGGTLYDIGIYCINAARYLFRAEPIEVSAMCTRSEDPRFREVDETTSATLLFPDGRLASFTCSFGSADTAHYRLVGTEGELTLDAAYEIAEPMRLSVSSNGKRTTRKFTRRDQFAPELMHFSDCILHDRTPGPSGEEGQADVRIIEALYRSAAEGRAVTLDSPPRVHSRPSLEQAISRPPIRKPVLLGVSSPSM